MFETEKETAARKAKEYVIWCRDKENQARIALAVAAESTKRAMERYEQKFAEAEDEAYDKAKKQGARP